MPELQRYLAQPRGGFVAMPTPQVQTGAVADGFASLAAGLDEVVKEQEQEAEQQGRIYNAKTDARIRGDMATALEKRRLSGEDLSGASSWAEAETTAAYRAAIDEAPNDYAKQYLEMSMADGVADLRNAGLRVESEFTVTKTMTDLDETLQQLTNLAALDPSKAGDYAGMWRAATADVQVPLEYRAKLGDGERSILMASAAALVERDPYAGSAYVKRLAGDQSIDAADALTLGNRADAGIKAREAEARARAAEAKAARAEELNTYFADADDVLSYAADGNALSPDLAAKYSPEAILAVTGDAKMAGKARDALTRGDALRAFREAGSPEARLEILDDVTIRASGPENYTYNKDTARIIQSAYADFEANLAKSPGEMAWQSARVQEAVRGGDGVSIVSASYAEQERLGVASWSRQPLSEGYAAQVADQINALPPDEQAASLQAMSKSYGGYWPDVLAQIGGKLSPSLAVSAVMPPGRAATRLANVAGLSREELTAGLDKDAMRDVEEAMADSERLVGLGRALSSQIGGPKTMKQYNDAVMRSALALMREDPSLSAGDAVEQAAEDVTADTSFIESGVSVVAVPSSLNRDIIATGLGAVQSGIDVSTIDLPETRSGMAEEDVRAAYASSIRRDGEWASDGKGKGLYLFVEGDVVTRDGQPVLFTWNDLKAAALNDGGFMFERGR